MSKVVKLPQISEDADSGTVSEILVSKGDKIEKDQSIIVIESDKASVEVPSPYAGIVEKINVEEGDELSVGDTILEMSAESESESGEEGEKEDEEEKKEKEKEGKEEEEEQEKEKDGKDKEGKVKEEKDEEKKEKEGKEDQGKDNLENDEEEKEGEENDEEEKEEEEKEEEEKEEEGKDKEGRRKKEKEEDGKVKEGKEEEEDREEEENKGKDVERTEKKGAREDSKGFASPAVRQFARELGVEMDNVEGSGEEGRITMDDVKATAFLLIRGGSPREKLPDFSRFGPVERKKLNNIRKITARVMTNAWQTIPHVTQFDEADISRVSEFIEENSDKAEKSGAKLTLTAILLKICGHALEEYPGVNASIDLPNEELILKKYINIGIAVDTEDGLLVPVIRDVNKKSVIDLAVDLTESAEMARKGKLKPESMEGGNFSISNLGGIGGTNFTPVVYPPQSAILGMSRAATKPVLINEEFQPRKILPLSLSYDHRVIDGALGARFLRYICDSLENPLKVLLEK